MASGCKIGRHLSNDTLNSHLKQIQEMEMETIELINNYGLLQENKQREIAIVKTQINECFEHMIDLFKAKQSQLTNKLDTLMADKHGDNLCLISSITTLINGKKRSLSQQFQSSSTYTKDAQTMVNHFNDSKLLYEANIKSIQQSMSTMSKPISIDIDRNRLSQIYGTLENIIQIDLCVHNAVTADKIKGKQPSQTDADDDESMIELVNDLQKQYEAEKEKNKRFQTEYLNKVTKYLSMEGSCVEWYDTNSTNNRIYQNWEPVLRTPFNMIDSKGKSKQLPLESLLCDVPDVADLGEFHSCVNKLKNGYVKWISSIAVKTNNRNDANISRRKVSRDSRPDAEMCIYEYAVKHQLEKPCFVYTKNESKKGGNVEGKLTFCGQTFFASGRKKKAARSMCFQLAMSELLR
eukprot:627041_1